MTRSNAVSLDGLPTPAPFDALAPAAVWQHFAALCRQPRPSKGEGPLREALRAWAGRLGLSATEDAAGNLLIRKPATAGCDAWPITVLQAHLDMVCQSNRTADHDWARDPLRPVLREGWVIAENTTLGADNGMGVALMLALLAETTARHGPLEALFTVDEESGMGGARGLDPQWLQGRRLLNLDTEEWGEFYVGCAGGCDVHGRASLTRELMPDGHQCLEIAVTGLRGGHSGVDIHEGRANAIKLLARSLVALGDVIPFRLVTLNGGTARNAIPREAQAVIAVDAGEWANIQAWGKAQADRLQAFWGAQEPGLNLSLLPCTAERTGVLERSTQERWLALLDASPHGVAIQSEAVPGVVDTSSNLGMVSLAGASGEANFMVRSLRPDGTRLLAGQIVSLCRLAGLETAVTGDYPGWTPNPASPLLALCQRVFKQTFGQDSAVRVIHAGLECGLIGAHYPGMDIVSFGPTIRGAHAPGERVEVASVAQVWQLLRAILAEPPA